jgi:uncharacterized protein (TIGR03086 family)
VVAGIQPVEWPNSTPCTGLDVRAVLSHLVGGNLLFAAIISGAARPDRDADVLGDEPLATYRNAADELRQAFADPDVLTTFYEAPMGTARGSGLVGVRIVEILVHGWDLARGTGQRADFPEDIAERALAAGQITLTGRPTGPGAPFGPEVPAPEGAPAIDRLAAFLGRIP